MKESKKIIKEHELNYFRGFKNLQEAWEFLNDWPANNEEAVKNTNGEVSGGILGMYDIVIHSHSAKIDKNFDFGRVLGYTYKKWTKLVNNYVNPNYLDLVTSEIQLREKKKGKPHYNYTFHFDNKYGSGKDCLISLTFSRRKNKENPVVTYNTRASEITKRLIFDFLLIQRICAHIYGKKQKVEVICQIAFGFLNLECFLMYPSWLGIDKVIRKQPDGSYSPFQQRVLKKYQHFLDTPLEKITFKVSQRAAAQVKKDSKGNPVAGVKKLLAKELTLFMNHKKRDKMIQLLDKK